MENKNLRSSLAGFTVVETVTVDPCRGGAFEVAKGQAFKLIDVEGKQVADLMAWSRADKSEYFSPAHTLTRNWNVTLNTGDCLATNKRKDCLRILEDTVGYHDMLVPCCDAEAYWTRYKIRDHRHCLGNIREAMEKHLASRGETAGVISDFPLSGEMAINIFMKNRIEQTGKIIYEEPVHGAGSYIVFEALMDLTVAVSACPQDQTPTNGWSCTGLSVEIGNYDND